MKNNLVPAELPEFWQLAAGVVLIFAKFPRRPYDSTAGLRRGMQDIALPRNVSFAHPSHLTYEAQEPPSAARNKSSGAEV